MPTLEANSLLSFDSWQKPLSLSQQIASYRAMVNAAHNSGVVTKRVTRTRTTSDTQWSHVRRPRGRRASIDAPHHCDVDYRTLLDVVRSMDDAGMYRSRRQCLGTRGHRCVKMTLTRRRSHSGAAGAPSLPTSPLTSDIDGVHSDLEDLVSSASVTPADTTGVAAAAEDSGGKGAGKAKDSSGNTDSSKDSKEKKPKGQRDKDGKPEEGADEAAADGLDNSEDEDGDDGDDGEDEDDGDEDEEEEEDDGVVRCVCGERNDGELMIQCEICQVWQHTLCMGIRDEKHIPDKYYCEKCRPEDHPYINSRPRTIVLAEANTIGATTMMRRSAVMAVAKMTAREEYRAAAAAAAIAASVAAAASTGGRSGSSRRASKKQVAKSETSQITASTNGRPSQPAKKGRRNRQKTHEPDEESEGEQTGNSGSNSSSDKSSGKGGKGGAKRAVGEAAGRGKRRKTSGSVSKENSATGSGNEENEGGAPTEDTVVQLPVLDTKMQRIAKQTGRGRSASSVVRSNSKSLATGSPRRGNKLAGASNGVVEENDEEEEEEKKRGQSMPGSPRSPSPSLQSLLLLENGSAAKGGLAVETGNASDGGQSTRTDRSNKRRRGGRGGASGRGGKHQRLTQSASNSPYISQGAGFGDSAPGADLGQRSRHTSPKGTPTAVAKDDGEYVNGNQGASSDDADAAAKDEEHAHHRQPKHQHPPIEMEDIDGNTITVPSNMLNTHGQPIYSSVTPETMCKIRYPHNRASLHELNRRAKQLLDWLGKAQSEYEHERLTWLRPLHAEDDEQQQQEEEEKPEVASPSALLRQQQLAGRRPSQSLSEAPTSPINPSDWPTDDPEQPREFPASDEQPSAEAMAMAVEENPAEPNRLRPTLSIMEDLVWRLIRFQETYAT